MNLLLLGRGLTPQRWLKLMVKSLERTPALLPAGKALESSCLKWDRDLCYLRKLKTPHCFHKVTGINPGILAKFQVR